MSNGKIGCQSWPVIFEKKMGPSFSKITSYCRKYPTSSLAATDRRVGNAHRVPYLMHCNFVVTIPASLNKSLIFDFTSVSRRAIYRLSWNTMNRNKGKNCMKNA